MNRRQFIKTMLSAGAGGAAFTVTGRRWIPFAEAIDLPKFSFAHITDLHLDVQGTSTWQHREKSIPLFIDTLRQLGRLPKLNFILFGGDQIHSSLNDRDSAWVFAEWLQQIGVPYYLLLGNTEVSPAPGFTRLDREDYLRLWSGHGLRPGRSSWSIDPAPGVRFIGLDVTVDGKPYGEATPARLRWLERELADNRHKNLIIVATHQLLYPATPQDLTPAWSLWMVRNHAQVRELLDKYRNVRLVLSGHHHASHVETVGRITYVSDPAIVTYPCAFRVFTISREGIHLANIGLDERSAATRARELLIADPYARIYDPQHPENVLNFSTGLREQDRETTILL
jgi:hypothetical protein